MLNLWVVNLGLLAVNAYSGGHGLDPCKVRQHYCLETDHEIFFTVILFSWFKKGICQFLAKECVQILVNHLED